MMMGKNYLKEVDVVGGGGSSGMEKRKYDDDDDGTAQCIFLLRAALSSEISPMPMIRLQEDYYPAHI